jgi:transposase
VIWNSKSLIQQLGTEILWITRVSATLNECKRLIDSDLDMVECFDSRYKCFSTTSNYGDIPQKWVVYQSEPMQARMEKTFEKRLEKEDRRAEEDLAKLRRREFAFEADAIKEAELWPVGNFWSVYSGIDVEGDGIGNVTRRFEGGEDQFPLMDRCENYSCIGG